MNQPQTLKGFRDFLPADMAVRNYVKKIFIEVFETFGFQPLETPAVEYASTLMGKYGAEADKLVYSFKDQGDRQVGLRYDLTVPASKVLSIYPNLPLPFKRYQIQPVWRAEKPQKGRYREVLQCDIDTFGSSSPVSDAEILTVIYNILLRLNFKKFSIRLNSRQVLYRILESSGIRSDQNTVLQSLDKFQKIGQIGVENELTQKGLSPQTITSIIEYIKQAQPDDYLRQVITRLDDFGVPKTAWTFDPTMVRGLDYYTGPIFETYVQEPKIGSVTGGGRYDNLIKSLGGPDTPAVGTTLGLDRIVDVINELGLLPPNSLSPIKIMLANFSLETEPDTIKLAGLLRQQNISTALYPCPDKLGKQFKYADSLKIPFVAILGEDEIKSGKVTLKDLQDGQQKQLSPNELIELLKS